MTMWGFVWDVLMGVLACLSMFIALSFFWAGFMFLYDAHEFLLKKVANYWKEKK